ncbi:hypothetical protein [Ideonella paludis]|uniref:HTH cro/C1-type domain-containing protein n=1 Tax=Ideonella paludis TaxID=1233411 RepID=A0ABS5E365_9BURK|nr:hypothetical protein [Ideonella paludis]MBQ0937863.1 hypothetical protein [Ideonella paludis]
MTFLAGELVHVELDFVPASALARQRRLSTLEVDRAAALMAFGQFIGNTAMHCGNLGLMVDLEGIRRGRFTLAPVYDRLPMHWRPNAAMGDAPDYAPFDLDQATASSSAARPAREFWLELEAHRSVSTGLKAVANKMAKQPCCGTSDGSPWRHHGLSSSNVHDGGRIGHDVRQADLLLVKESVQDVVREPYWMSPSLCFNVRQNRIFNRGSILIDMNTIQDVSAALRKALQESGKTQQALRESAGLSRQTMVNVMRGSEDYRLSTLLAVADRLGLALVLVPKSSAAGLQASSQAPAVESVVDLARQMLKRTGAREGGERH